MSRLIAGRLQSEDSQLHAPSPQFRQFLGDERFGKLWKYIENIPNPPNGHFGFLPRQSDSPSTISITRAALAFHVYLLCTSAAPALPILVLNLALPNSCSQLAASSLRLPGEYSIPVFPLVTT